jgi:lysophospholipase L1-like esterase
MVRFIALVIVLLAHVSSAATAAEARVLRVACVGDSITAGSNVEDPATASYPAQLQALLGPSCAVQNFGVGGRTLLRQQDPFDIAPALQAHPDIVVIMLGTNDARRTTWEAHGSAFVSDYLGIIAEFRALRPAPRIWLCLPPPLFPGQWGLTEPVLADQVMPAIRAVAAETKLPLIDLHAALSARASDFPDTVHPNAAGYRTIAETVARALRSPVTQP